MNKILMFFCEMFELRTIVLYVLSILFAYASTCDYSNKKKAALYASSAFCVLTEVVIQLTKNDWRDLISAIVAAFIFTLVSSIFLYKLLREKNG